MKIYNPQPENPAGALMLTLQNEQALLEQDLPKESKITATVTLTTGDEIKIVAAYATEPDLIVFIGLRDGKSVRLITSYSMFAYCTFQLVKGKRQPIGFFQEPPSPSPSASPSAS